MQFEFWLRKIVTLYRHYYTGTNIANYPLFLNIKLNRKKTVPFFLPTGELAKLSMRKNYVSLTLIKLKIKEIRISHKDKLYNTSNLQIRSYLLYKSDCSV